MLNPINIIKSIVANAININKLSPSIHANIILKVVDIKTFGSPVIKTDNMIMIMK